jgi:hypothetical protein
VKRLIFSCLLGGMLVTNTGCGLFHAIFCYRPYGMRTDCGPDVCGDPCDDTCGPMRPGVCATRRARACDLCGPDCDGGCGRPCCRHLARGCAPCDDPCADPCGSGCCGPRPWHRGPLSCVFALFVPSTWCGGACGERYWGDFYSDPPDCWDQCDSYGNYTGGGCRSCNSGNAGFQGYTRGPAGGDFDDGGIPQGNIISQTDRAVGATPQPHKAKRPQQ